MYLIGITGSIASGKSSIRQMLEGKGYQTLDADVIAHEVLEHNDDLWAKLVNHFGDSILNHDGSICRSCLARLVFADELEKEFLEEQIHPLITAALLDRLNLLIKEGDPGIVFIEATLIFQAGIAELLDEIWLIDCPREIQSQRLIDKRQFSNEEAAVRIEAIEDLSEEQKEKCVRIDNSKTFQYTEKQVDELLADIQKKI